MKFASPFSTYGIRIYVRRVGPLIMGYAQRLRHAAVYDEKRNRLF